METPIVNHFILECYYEKRELGTRSFHIKRPLKNRSDDQARDEFHVRNRSQKYDKRENFAPKFNNKFL